MKNILLKVFLLLVLLAVETFPQYKYLSNSKMAGAPPNIRTDNSQKMPNGFISPRKVSSTQYSTTVFTFADITIFSYFDDTQFQITDSYGTVVGSATLKADTLYNITLAQGIYSVSGNKPYSVLIGDAITSYVNGYFALDQSGKGTSTKLNTWMMTGDAQFDPHFIIFAYQDGTQYTIKDLTTGSFVYAGTLNNGQYLDFPNVSSIQGKALQVVSNKPVSALSYTDQDYYVPSSDGKFAGSLFYGFSGYSGQWINSITVTSYSNNNNIVITDLASGATIASYTLGMWQVRTIPISSDTFWKVQASGRVTAANIPFAQWTGDYYYMARTADSTGTNIGTEFIVPTIASQVSVFSYNDNNRVNITFLGDTTYPYTSPTLVADTLLQTGQSYVFYSNVGHNVYRISSQKNVSVLQSNGAAGADFMPLGYSLDLPDLAVSQQDINFNIPDSVYVTGDTIKITVTAHNYGTITANNVDVVAYDGDPDAGFAPQIGSINVPSIDAGGSYSFSFNYIVPKNAQYHYIYVKVDPNNNIMESNESNNKASRPLKPNTDLLPPLAVTVTAPNALSIDQRNNLTPNPFLISTDIFNTGNVTATNVHVTLTLYNGLTLVSGPIDTTLGNILAYSNVQVKWAVNANKDSSGLNFYIIHVTCDNASPKDVNRAVNVPDQTPPSSPLNLVATSLTAPGSIELSWIENTEKDFAGYEIYYGLSPNDLSDTSANEGKSPITIGQFKDYVLTGLKYNTTYYFALKAFDLSGNLSGYSNVVSAITNSENSCSHFTIVKIKDVPNDQGGQVRIEWGAHCFDIPNSARPITQYSIWRKVDPKYFTKYNEPTSTPTGNWEQVGLVNAVQDTMYFAVVPSLYDSSKANGTYYTTYFVRAHTADPLTHYETSPDSGYSVDNLAPAAPTNVTAAFKNNFVELDWKAATEPDFKFYTVYRSQVPNINIDAVSPYKYVSTNKFIDSSALGGNTYYYRLTANDFSGNRSKSSSEVSVTITDVLSNDSETPKNFALEQSYPNPFNPSSIISYAVPKASYVTIEIFNALGEKVETLVSADKKAGIYQVQFNANNLPSGIYFYRMIAGNFIETKKMMLLK